jgi:hypothetical protein
MQASRIKLGEMYALQRGADTLVRFHVTEIVTRKTYGGTSNEIVGEVIEDRKPDGPKVLIKTLPDNLLGPYEEHAALVERNKRETAEREAQKAADMKQARIDRLMLYAFVGIEAPKDLGEYRQPFRISHNSVDATSDGMKAIIDKVRELNEQPTRHVVSLNRR